MSKLTVSVEFTCVNLYYNLCRQCYGSNKGSACQSAGCEHILNVFFFLNVSNEKRDIFLFRNRDADLHFDANYRYFIL